MLGKLRPEYFPKIFGTEGNQTLDLDIVEKKFATLAESIGTETGDGRTPHGVAEGFLKIAIDNMANAIKKISVQRGYNVTKYTLCCFGGAGGNMHVLWQRPLGIETILIHPYAGVLSAYGMGLGDIRSMCEETVEDLLSEEIISKLEQRFTFLEKKASNDLSANNLYGSVISTDQIFVENMFM